MKQWNVYAKVTGSKWLGTFEAKTKKEAMEKAEKKAFASFCHQCSGECEDPEVEIVNAEEVTP